MELPTLAAGAIAFVAALVMATVGRMRIPLLIVALTLTASGGAIEGTVGPWIRDKMQWVADLASNAIQSNLQDVPFLQVAALSGTVIMYCVGLAVFGVLAFMILNQQIDHRTLGVALVAPVTTYLIPGAGGTIAVWMVTLVPSILGAGISMLFRLG